MGAEDKRIRGCWWKELGLMLVCRPSEVVEERGWGKGAEKWDGLRTFEEH